MLTHPTLDLLNELGLTGMAKGFQDPDLQEGLVDTSGCVALRSSHLQVISLSALKKWRLWSLDIKNAFLRLFLLYFFSAKPYLMTMLFLGIKMRAMNYIG